MQAAAAFSLPLPLPMPIAAPKPCVVCRVLVTDGSARCPAHKPAPWVKRADAPKRITGRRLQRMRRDLFARQPLCEECARHGRVTLATERDHRIALAEGGIDAAGENEQALCAACNREKGLAEALRARGGMKKSTVAAPETDRPRRPSRAGVGEGGVS